jgi:hypothetical protein
MAIGSDEEKIVFNGTLLTGIQNISFSQNVSEEPVEMLGNDFVTTEISGPTTFSASVSKLLLNTDFLRTLTGSTTINGQFEYGENYLDFNSGVLGGYTLNASIGEIPSIEFSFEIFGDVSGANSATSSTAETSAIQEVSQTGIQVTFDKQSTNAVQSFSFTENYTYETIYGLNITGRPSEIKLIGPVEQEVSIAMEVDDNEIEDGFSFLNDTKNRNRTIKLDLYLDDGTLQTFSLESGHFVNQSYSAGAGDTVISNLTYRGYKKV